MVPHDSKSDLPLVMFYHEMSLKICTYVMYVKLSNYSPRLPPTLSPGLTRGSLSHSASEHSEVTLLWVVEAESLRETSALPGCPNFKENGNEKSKIIM